MEKTESAAMRRGVLGPRVVAVEQYLLNLRGNFFRSKRIIRKRKKKFSAPNQQWRCVYTNARDTFRRSRRFFVVKTRGLMTRTRIPNAWIILYVHLGRF